MSEWQELDDAKGGIRGRDPEFGPLPQLLGYQIRQAQTALFKDFSNITSSLKVTPGEFSLLTLIETNPGVSQTSLTSLYKVDKSTLSLSLGSLAKRGLVRRVRGPLDNRYYALWLSEAGRRVLRKVRARVDAQERMMDAVLRPGERAHLLDMLSRIAGAFDMASPRLAPAETGLDEALKAY